MNFVDAHQDAQSVPTVPQASERTPEAHDFTRITAAIELARLRLNEATKNEICFGRGPREDWVRVAGKNL